MLVCVADPEIAFDGSASDREGVFGAAGASGPTSLHPPVHGGRADSPWGARGCGGGLLHFYLGAQGGASGALDRVSSDDDVRAGFGVVANDCRNLHTVGGLPEPVNGCPPEVNR